MNTETIRTRTQTISAATQAARSLDSIARRSLADINALIAADTSFTPLGHDDQTRQWASEALAQHDIPAKWHNDFLQTFCDTAGKVWHNILQQHTNAQRNWNSVVKRALPVNEAAHWVAAIIKECGIRGAQISPFGQTVSVNVERGRYIGGTITASFWHNTNTILTNPDNETQSLVFFRPEVSVQWSSRTLTPEQAAACLPLYQELTNVALELKIRLDEEKIALATGFDLAAHSE